MDQDRNLAQRWSLRGGRFLGWGGFFDPVPPPPSGTGCVKGILGASGASTVRFGKNFKKQKLQGTSDLGGVTFLGPKSGSNRTWAPCPSGAMVAHYKGEFIKSKLHDMSLIAILLGWPPYTLPPGSKGPKRGASGVLEPQPCILGVNL